MSKLRQMQEKLKKQLLEKKEQEKNIPYKPKKLDKDYKVILINWSAEQIMPPNYPIHKIKQCNAIRIYAINQMVEQYVESIKPKLKDLSKQKMVHQINLSLKQDWLDDHMNTVPYMVSGFNGKQHPYFQDAKMIVFFDNQIVLLDHQISKEHMYIEFLVLCFLFEYGKGTSHDLIVHLDSWKYFMSISIGLEFLSLLKHHDIFKAHAEHLNNSHLIIHTQDYGAINYPSKDEIYTAREYLQVYGYWIYYLQDIMS